MTKIATYYYDDRHINDETYYVRIPVRVVFYLPQSLIVEFSFLWLSKLFFILMVWEKVLCFDIASA